MVFKTLQIIRDTLLKILELKKNVVPLQFIFQRERKYLLDKINIM